MNINMQQSYWLADIAGASETMTPLIDFIQKLSINGRYSAKNLYGCKSPDSWVAHGFTDNRMKTGMIGEPQWSLCVTCGAWLALHIFDHLTFNFSKELLIEKNIPILRGIIHFFLEYFYKDEYGFVHTGPTTSPENSYEVTNEVKDNIELKKM
jgi:alpha-L-fucosidase 2